MTEANSAGSPACPCGADEVLASCCGRFIDGDALAETAEQLMRSRYTAFALGNEAYLRATWHPSSCPEDIHVSSEVRWIGLQVKRTERGTDRDRTGIVEFVARSKRGGRARRLHETSRFVLENGRWLYLGPELKTGPNTSAPESP